MKEPSIIEKICLYIALWINIGIINIIWFLICCIIYPFRRKWVYSFEKTTKHVCDMLVKAQELKKRENNIL